MAEVAEMAEKYPIYAIYAIYATTKKQERRIIMAHYVPAAEFKELTGALSKKKEQQRLCITRIKSIRDPLTGEVVGRGKKEIFAQERRDYDEAPLTPAEQKQRAKWREACREASVIVKDKSHPRYMELYQRWREQLDGDEPMKMFANFVRATLVQEV